MTASAPVPAFVSEDLTALGIELSDQTIDQLGVYLDLLLDANQRMNLTGARDRDEAWRRHVVDSLTILPGLDELPAGARVIDVGSGGGLPGLPVAIARPGLRLTLLEATGKKAAFLREAVTALALPSVDVIQDRAETHGREAQGREAYDAVICRAVGPMPVLLELTLPLLTVGGRLLAMKGPSVEAELDRSGDALAILGAGDMQIFDAWPEGSEFQTVIVSVFKERSTPPEYPRAPGIPKQAPL